MLPFFLSLTATAAPPEFPVWCREVVDGFDCRDLLEQDKFERLVAYARSRGEIRRLSLGEFYGTDVSGLGALTTLESLTITGSDLVLMDQGLDLSSLAKLKGLKSLSLSSVGATDLTPLTELPALERLFMSRMEETELAPVARIADLRTLVLQDNYCCFDDLSPLAGAKKLRDLDVSSDDDDPLEGLETLTQLQELRLDLSGQALDLTPILKLTDLTELAVCFDKETPPPDWTVLKALPKLKELRLICPAPGVLEAAQAAIPGIEVEG